MEKLAYCYVGGIGVTKDLTQATYWLQKAAEQGSVVAQVDLGMAYRNGVGMEKNRNAALYWLEKALENEKIAELETFTHLNYADVKIRIESLKDEGYSSAQGKL